MRLKLLISAAFLFFCGVLRADTITGSFTGFIGGTATTDTHGLFGRAGADLNGDSVTIQYSYNAADFQSASAVCINCIEYDSVKLSSSESVSFTLNGQTQSFSPSYRSDLIFQNAFAGTPYNLFVEGIDNSEGHTGVELGLQSANNVAFDQAIVLGGSLNNSIEFIIPSTGGYTFG